MNWEDNRTKHTYRAPYGIVCLTHYASDDTWMLHDLVVTRPGRGYGTQLVMEAARKLKDFGVQTVTVSVAEGDDAQRFWSKFNVVGKNVSVSVQTLLEGGKMNYEEKARMRLEVAGTHMKFQDSTSKITFTSVKFHGEDGNEAKVYSGISDKGWPSVFVVLDGKLIATSINDGTCKTLDDAKKKADFAVSNKLQRYWDSKTPMERYFNIRKTLKEVASSKGKVKPEHYRQLEKLIREVERKHPDAKEKYAKAGLSDKRYRWDMLYAIPREVRTKLMDALYVYCNDDHIDTALKSIVK